LTVGTVVAKRNKPIFFYFQGDINT